MTKKRVYFLYLLIGTLFSIAFAFTSVYYPESNTVFTPIKLVLGFLLFFALTFFLYKISCFSNYIDFQLKSDEANRLSLFFFSAFLFVGVFYLIIFFPGTCFNDTVYIVRWGLGMASQHPWLYCLSVNLITRFIIHFGGNYAVVFFVLAFLQILLCALIYTSALIWLRYHGLSMSKLLLVFALYCFCPIYDIYMVTIVKDVPFSLFLFSWFPLLYDCWITDGRSLTNKSIYLMGILIILVSLLRGNGPYISAFIIFGLFVFYGRKYRKRVFLLLLSLVFAHVINSCAMKYWNVTHLFKETIGIPLQQIAATVANDGNLSSSDKKFIERIMPLDAIKRQYNPYSADALKWSEISVDNDFLNSNKVAVLKHWFTIGVKNPKIYIKAYLQITYGFWSLDNSQDNIMVYYSLPDGFDDWFDYQLIRTKSILSEKPQTVVEGLIESSVLSLGQGTLFWLFIIMASIMCLKYGFDFIVVILPVLGGWLSVMVSTPVAFQFRYTLYILMAIPFMIGILLINSTKKRGD